MAITRDTELLTIAEAARLLKISTVTLHRWLKQGRLAAYRVGPRAVRISRSELARILTPRSGQEVSSVHEALQVPADLAVAQPTQEQISRRRTAMREARALREEMRARRGGSPLPSSWRLIREARQEHATRR